MNDYIGRHRDNSEQAEDHYYVREAMAKLPEHACNVIDCQYVGKHRPAERCGCAA